MRMQIVLVAGLMAVAASSAEAKGDEAKQARKVARAAAKRVQQWMRARDRRVLLKKGSGLKATKKTLRASAAVSGFLGFVPAAYRKQQGSPEVWIKSLFRGRRPNFLGQPLPVRSHTIRSLVVHRDAVTVDVEVTFDTAKAETRGLRLVWAKEKSKLVLSLRKPERALANGRNQSQGPIKSGVLLKTGPKSALSGNAFLLQTEELLAEQPKPKEAQEALNKLSLADFGEFVGTTTEKGVEVGEVRCGYLLVRITPTKGDDFAGLKAGDTVLFSGDVTRVRGKNPWVDRSYERKGVKYEQRCVVVNVTGSAGKRAR